MVQSGQADKMLDLHIIHPHLLQALNTRAGLINLATVNGQVSKGSSG